MKVKVFTVILSSLVVFLLVSGCINEPQHDEFVTVASWNVQNLFDACDNGTENGYSQFTSAGYWTEDLYRQRLQKVAQVLNYGDLRNADIIVLNEIENEDVVKDIISSRGLSSRGFKWYVFAKNPGDAIGTAVLSRFEIEEAHVHSTDTRPIIEVSFTLEGGELTVLAVHAKSRREGEEETAEERRQNGSVLSEVAEDILRRKPGEMILIAGDLNDTYNDNCIMSTTAGQAPLPVASYIKTGFWYCFWMDDELELWPTGSYWWSKDSSWEALDNILVRGPASELTVVDAGVVFEGILKTADGKPNAFVRNLMTGVSDHLPIWVSLY